jgi:UDP-N-acetylglucosamine--N-acetylmuramyl-(pentapeptide) pyrophosphoryl-undecaprenol N-acetylglucosamine transferase
VATMSGTDRRTGKQTSVGKGKTIVFTGGGSAGHVLVNLSLIPRFQEKGWAVVYVGSEQGIERELVIELQDVPYTPIATGKLRRYFDWKNFKDPFKVIKGVGQAFRHIRRTKPDVIFSKGGFVSVPVIIAGWLNRVPMLIHESDMTPGLANRIAIPFVDKVCVTFPETVDHFKQSKAVHVGPIVRDELYRGEAERGRQLCGFSSHKPVLLVMGGSLGAKRINETVRGNVDSLVSEFQIVHICGKGQVEERLNKPGYRQFEYLQQELADIMAMTDVLVSRAGSNSIFEFLALRKPMLLIPLSEQASRGDQILNARSFQRSGFADVLAEEDLTDTAFVEKVRALYHHRADYVRWMEQERSEDAIRKVTGLIEELV